MNRRLALKKITNITALGYSSLKALHVHAQSPTPASGSATKPATPAVSSELPVQRVLSVAAASGVADVVRSIAKVLEKQRPGLRVDIETGASDALVARVANYAKFDVVLLSDDTSMSRLVATKKVLRIKVQEFARNEMVLLSKIKLSKLEDLVDERIKLIALGDPSQVAAGRYARESLVLANLWNELEPKFVFASNVRNALDFVVRGSVDAAIVYRSDTLVKGAKSLQMLPLGIAATHWIAPTLSSPNRDDAAAFVDFATSASARVALKQLQFGIP